MRNVESEGDFYAKGGTELAPMSGTTSLTVAVQYALGHAQGDTAHALMFKIVARSFIDRGADLAFLSCFPGEAEWCYPPLTYLSPTGRREAHTIEGINFFIVEVEPRARRFNLRKPVKVTIPPKVLEPSEMLRDKKA